MIDTFRHGPEEDREMVTRFADTLSSLRTSKRRPTKKSGITDFADWIAKHRGPLVKGLTAAGLLAELADDIWMAVEPALAAWLPFVV